MSDNWPPRFTLSAEGAVRLIMLNYLTEQNQEKTELALIRLVNEAFEQGKRSTDPTSERTP
jgi:hypothetical protein